MTHPVSEVNVAGLFFGALMFVSESNFLFFFFFKGNYRLP